MLLALPLLAQDKGAEKKTDAKDKAEKKDDAKDKMEKKDDKKADTKDEKKSADKNNKYQLVNTITGKFSKLDTEEMLIEVEVRVPSGRSIHTEKQTFTYVSDAKVRTLKLPERLDDSKKPIPYTSQEKAKLKGDNPKLKGYASDLNSLKNGQMIEFDLSTRKSATGAAKKTSDEPEKPFVTLITIVEEPPKMIEKKKK